MPLPGGRTWRCGAGDPNRACRFASLIAQLSLTPNRRAAARREWPASTNEATRWRRSTEKHRPMIHLRHAKGITNPSRPKAESLFLSDALEVASVGKTGQE